MTAKAFSSPLAFGIPAFLAGIAIAAAGTWAAIAKPPSPTGAPSPADIESPVGRRAAVQYKVSATPLSLMEVTPPISRHDAERYCQTQRAYVESTLVLTSALAQPGIATLSVFSNSTDKIGWLKEHLLVTFPNGGEIMEISVADDKAPKEDLIALANAVSKSYFDEVVFREQGERTLPLQILQTSLRRLSGQVRDKMDTLRQLEADIGHDAESLAKRQWSADEAWLLRQRIEELRTQHFDEKLRRLQTDSDSEDDASAKEAESKRAAIDNLFAAEEKRLKDQLDETKAALKAESPESSTDLDLRRQEIESLKEQEKHISHRIHSLQIETQRPNRVHAIGSKGDESGTAEFYDN